jgi:hypothetical protein
VKVSIRSRLEFINVVNHDSTVVLTLGLCCFVTDVSLLHAAACGFSAAWRFAMSRTKALVS